ncbi:GNAT family N-acetyltransferase [Paenibacillus gallinarum]|uniref:GNAT family N-acetyltransferase n=1 Tax=Paenibacillus gallinarum TaxID=2762232 RepID=A0ABR8T0P0_9BACL|nr:GNAT family N-acetyltransferase [Paenibacillus gallinarum]MBD7969311.1 GNAT family N-acetyltransferase [Paenibacillus gallinarum]
MISIETIQIKPIHKYTNEEQKNLGEFGYVTDSKYRVSKRETKERTVIEIELIELESMIHKSYTNSEEDYERYSKIASTGYSLGAYIGTELVGVVIAEEMQWNNTLLIWHFQVAEDWRKKSIGKQLMNELTCLAKVNRIRAINLETQNTNANAINFYRKCGFEIEGVDLSYYTNNDVLDGEVAIFMKSKIG